MAYFLLVALISCLVAGLANGAPGARIVGGSDATESQFPHQVSLRRSGSHTCGGSIISRTFVLTAAHCVGNFDDDMEYYTYNPNLFTVRAGSTNRLSGGVLLRVTQIIAHKDYMNFLNDIALLRLESPLIFSKNIQPIPIAKAEVPSGKPVIVSGWGLLKATGDSPIKLQWTTLTAISKSECKEKIDTDSEALLCLDHKENNGVCFGDSGGPAIYNGELVGAAGFVIETCGTHNPDGYTKVFYHREWIRQHADL